MNKNNLPDNLYELRRKNAISQEEFADKLGVSRQAVSKWERGEAYPDTENLIAISEIFGVTIDSLLNEKAVSQDSSTPSPSMEPKAEGAEFGDGTGDDDIDPDDPDGDYEDDEDDEERVKSGTPRRGMISILYAVPYPIVTALAFLVIGLFTGGWYWAWTLFITIPVYYSLLDSIRRRRMSEFAYPVLITFLYCLFGMLFSWWHPGWIIFITIPIYYPIAEAADKYYRSRRG